MMSDRLATLFVDIEARMEGFEKGMSTARSRMEDVGKRATTLGKTMVGMGVAAGGSAIGLIKMASDFESSFAGVRKTVDATETEFAALSDGFRDMAKEIPVSVNELNRIGEAAGQLGIDKDNILDFSRTMADLGVTTNMSSDEAATALARLANITKMPQDKFDELGSTVVALGNNLATTEGEIVEMSLRLAGAGAQVGLTESQILSMSGALSSVGIRAEAGGTAFSRVMVDIANSVAEGGIKLDRFAKVAGMSSSEFAAAFEKDAAGAIISFVEGLGEVEAQGGNTFKTLEDLELGEIRVRDALLRASGAGDLFRESLEIGSKAWEENTALTNEASTRYETFASQAQILKNRLADMAITIGLPLMKALSDLIASSDPLIKMMENAAKRVAEFTDEHPELVKWLLAGTAAFTAIGGALLAFGLAIGPIMGSVAALGAAIGLLLNPVGLVVVAVAGLAAGLIYAYKQSETFRAVVTAAVDSVSGVLGGLRAAVAPAITAFSIMADGAKDSTGVAIASFQRVRDEGGSIFDALGTSIGKFTGNLKDYWSEGVVHNEKLHASFRDSFGGMGGVVADAATKIISQATEMFTSLKDLAAPVTTSVSIMADGVSHSTGVAIASFQRVRDEGGSVFAALGASAGDFTGNLKDHWSEGILHNDKLLTSFKESFGGIGTILGSVKDYVSPATETFRLMGMAITNSLDASVSTFHHWRDEGANVFEATGKAASNFGGNFKDVVSEGILHNERLHDSFKTRFDGIKTVVTSTADGIQAKLTVLGAHISENLPEPVKEAADSVGNSFASMGKSAADHLSPITGVANDAFGSVKTAVDDNLPEAQTTAGNAFTNIRDFAQDRLADAGNIASTAFGAVKDAANDHLPVVQEKAGAAFGAVKGFAEDNFPKVTQFASDAFTKIKSLTVEDLADAGRTVRDTFLGMKNSALENFPQIHIALDTAKNFVMDYVDNIRDAIEGAIGAVKAAIQGDWTESWEQAERTFDTAAAFILGRVHPLVAPFNAGGVFINALDNATGHSHKSLNSISKDFLGIQESIGKVTGVVASVVGEMGLRFAEVIGRLAPSFNEMWTFVKPLLVELGETVKAIFEGMVTVVEGALNVIEKVLSAGAAVLEGIWDRFGDTFLAIFEVLWTSIFRTLDTAITLIRDTLIIVLNLIQGDWGEAWQGMKDLVTNLFGNIRQAIEDVGGAIFRLIQAMLGDIAGVWGEVWGGLQGVLEGVWGGIKGAAQSGLDGLKAVFIGALDGIKALWSTAWDAVRGIFDTEITSWPGKLGGTIKDFARNAFDLVKTAITDQIPAAVLALAGAVVAFVKDVGEWPGRLASAIGDFVSGIFGNIKDLFRSETPAAVTSLAEAPASFISDVMEWPGRMASAIGSFAADIFQNIKDKFTSETPAAVTTMALTPAAFIKDVAEWAGRLAGSLVSFVADIFTNVKERFKGEIPAAVTALALTPAAFIKDIGAWAGRLATTIASFVGDIYQHMRNLLTNRIPTVMEGVEKVFTTIRDFFIDLPGRLGRFITGFVTVTYLKVRNGLIDQMGTVHNGLGKIFATIREFFKDLPGKLGGFITGFVIISYAKMWNAFRDNLATVKSGAEGIFRTLRNFIQDLPGRLGRFIEDMGRAIFRKIKDAMPSLGDVTGLIPDPIKSAGGSAKDTVKDWFDFRQHGGPILPGGWAIVGESGPELVHSPSGSQVFSHEDSREMLAGSGGTTINLTVNSPEPLSPVEVRRHVERALRDVAYRSKV